MTRDRQNSWSEATRAPKDLYRQSPERSEMQRLEGISNLIPEAHELNICLVLESAGPHPAADFSPLGLGNTVPRAGNGKARFIGQTPHCGGQPREIETLRTALPIKNNATSPQ